jgi:hypothetical protein
MRLHQKFLAACRMKALSLVDHNGLNHHQIAMYQELPPRRERLVISVLMNLDDISDISACPS